MSDIILIHRKTNQDLPNSIKEFGIWQTCLRQIALMPKNELAKSQFMQMEQDEIKENEAALEFLIEILCGLHSPVFAETEVFGQFKKFILQLPQNNLLKLQPQLLNFIMTTVKSVRNEYLKSCGGLSYGHVLRKKIPTQQNISLWGHGQLALEIKPWLSEQIRQSIVRNPEKYLGQNLKTKENRIKTEVHIIAAPLSDDEVLALLSEGPTELIYDLRGQTKISHPQIISLFEIMSEIEVLKQKQKQILPQCLEEIRNKVKTYYNLCIHRPFGWEDLCS